MTAPTPAMRFLDPQVLRTISSIELKAKFLVEGMYASRHRSPSYGYSVEFVDHREYAAGDEPRTIDWKMLARTEKYFVKRFEMESNMDVVCLLDVSGSMGYRPLDAARLTKLEYASYLAASLCYLVRNQQDAAGLVTFDSAIRDFLPARQGQRHLFTILSKLNDLQCRAQTNIEQVLKLLALRLKRRGIVLLISDCHGDADRVLEGVRHLVTRGHELILFHLLDSDEVRFPFNRLTSFRDLETGVQVMTDPARISGQYLQRLSLFREQIKTGCVGSGADYRFIETAEPIEQVLRDYLLYRRQRGN